MSSDGVVQPCPPDIHHKMCKKIAQLTKVIYHLNTTNEDWSDRSAQQVNELSAANSRQLKELEAEWKLKLDRVRDELNPADMIVKYERTVKELSLQLDLEKSSAIAAVTGMQRQSREALAAARSDNEKAIAALQLDLATTKSDFQKRLSVLQSDRDQLFASLNSSRQSLAEAEAAHARAMDEAAESARRDQQAAVAGAQARARSALEAAATEATLALARQLAGQSKLWQEKVSSLESSLACVEGQVKAATACMATLQSTLAVCEKERDDWRGRALEAGGALQALQVSSSTEQAKLQAEIQRLKSVLSQRDSHIDDLSAQLTLARSSLAEQSDRCDTSSRRVAELEELLAGARSSADGVAGQLRLQLVDAQSSKIALQSAVDKLHCELTAAKESASTAAEAAQPTEIALRDSISRLEAELSAVRAAAAADASALEQQCLRRIADLSSQHEVETAAAAVRHQLELSAAVAAAEQSVRHDCAADKEASLLAQQHRHGGQLDQIRIELSDQVSSSQEEVARLQSALETALAQLASLSATQDAVASSQGELISDRDAMRQQMARLASELQQSQSTCAHVSDQLAASMAETASATDRANTLQRQLLEQQAAHERSLASLAESRAARIAEVQADGVARAGEMAQQMRLDMDEAVRVARLEGDAVLAAERSSNTQEVDRLTGRIAGLEAELAALAGRGDASAATMLAAHHEELQRLRLEHDAVMESQRNKLLSDAGATIQSMRDDADRELRLAKAGRDQALADLTARLNAAATQDREAVTRQLQADAAAALADVHRSFDGTSQSFRKQLSDLQSSLSQERSLRAAAEDRCAAAVETGRAEMARQLSEVEARHRSEMLAVMDQGRAALAQLESRMHVMSQRHSNDVSDLQSAFASERASFADAASALAIQVASLQARLEARESRPEDLTRIQRLTSLVKAKDEEVKRCAEEVKFYKLELLNRETNFNKVFTGRQPTVGVLGPGTGQQQQAVMGMKQGHPQLPTGPSSGGSGFGSPPAAPAGSGVRAAAALSNGRAGSSGGHSSSGSQQSRPAPSASAGNQQRPSSSSSVTATLTNTTAANRPVTGTWTPAPSPPPMTPASLIQPSPSPEPDTVRPMLSASREHGAATGTITSSGAASPWRANEVIDTRIMSSSGGVSSVPSPAGSMGRASPLPQPPLLPSSSSPRFAVAASAGTPGSHGSRPATPGPSLPPSAPTPPPMLGARA